VYTAILALDSPSYILFLRIYGCDYFSRL